jgi:hypothetical protein
MYPADVSASPPGRRLANRGDDEHGKRFARQQLSRLAGLEERAHRQARRAPPGVAGRAHAARSAHRQNIQGGARWALLKNLADLTDTQAQTLREMKRSGGIL